MTLLNRSLERGLAILDCFRPGTGLLAHRDIAERTGLPKPTVTRLLETLRQQGYVVFDEVSRGYRLGVPILSLSRSLRLESALIDAMAPHIARIARETTSVIGFGTAHGADIVYLEAANGDPARLARRVGPGMRAPIAATSVGRAYLAGLPPEEREHMIRSLSSAYPRQWRPDTRRQIEDSIREVRELGYCLVTWSEGRHPAIGAPTPVRGSPLHALSIGYVASNERPHRVPRQMIDALNELRACVQRFNTAPETATASAARSPGGQAEIPARRTSP
ncbi:MAG: IclR family transcriptional regulator [Burkholderiaceae bacterium]|nr:IclR family transcriptional regulator [Burkholderiaceae bacterium]